MFTYSEKRSYFKFEVCFELQSRQSISAPTMWPCACAPNILASIDIMQPQKVKIAFFVWLIFFLLHRQRVLLLHQAYHFLIVEEEFRIRRRNQRWAILTFFGQMNQQKEQRRRRRAWLWPRPQNLFHSLLASRDLDFLWKEHFRVTHETFEY